MGIKGVNLDKGPKVVQIQAVAMSGQPVLVDVPGLRDDEGNVVSPPRKEVIAPTTESAIFALREDGSIYFRTTKTPWMEVDGIEEAEVEMTDEELARLARDMGIANG